ncbi:methyltransferase [Leucobacter sp. gxy201]|uniref:methyltransferase family protein n=1 Tax=Leucobacter sp. gxy201 TaxID=2957200 RepID=UPI003DA17E34
MTTSERTGRVRGFWVTPSIRARTVGRAYFAVQAGAGLLWWVGVFAVPGVREATLGGIEAVPMAIADVPLFVVASAIAASLGPRGAPVAAGTAAIWTLLVTLGLAVYATITGSAGWGALLMAAASIGGLGSWMLLVFDRIPADRVLIGALGIRTSRSAPPGFQLARTLLQLLAFWLIFLAILPGAILFFEHRWGLHADFPDQAGPVGAALLLLASALGLWAAFAMSLNGDGTPLPSATANRLVIAGPYRFVRNPMALAGIAQAMGVGLLVESWLVVLYALAGIAYWNELVRPFEEADLEARFGDDYARYRAQVRCWVPRVPPTAGN